MIYNNITNCIGNTPIVKINNINTFGSNIYAKLESFNPMSSIKDRIASNMINNAEMNGYINKETVIVEPTSGNTGIGLAMICASKGLKLILTMPENMSEERKKLLNFLGAKLILTPKEKGMKGSIEKAKEISDSNKNYFMPYQFSNPANPEAHKNTTGPEIYNDFKDKIDYLVCGVGTGGTLTGTGSFLKEKISSIKCVAVEPENSAVISGNQPGPHKIQGIGAGFIPDNLDTSIIDEIIQISDKQAFDNMRQLAQKEGIFVGISSGAAFSAALKIAQNKENLNIIVIFPDSGDKYLSMV